MSRALPQLKRRADMQELGIPDEVARFFVEAPASIELIEQTERELGLRFPDQLRQFYKQHNGYDYEMLSYPYWKTLEEYSRHEQPSHDGLLVIANCYSTNPQEDFLPYDSIQRRKHDYTEIPDWLLPFGFGTDQKQLCISLRTSDYGMIYFFSMSYYYELDEADLEEDPLAPLYFVSPSLQDFLNSLRP